MFDWFDDLSATTKKWLGVVLYVLGMCFVLNALGWIGFFGFLFCALGAYSYLWGSEDAFNEEN